MVKIMIYLKKDSRDIPYSKHYGQTTIFPVEYNVDTLHADTIQLAGDVKCTAITTCDIACDQTKTQYDHNELFARIPSDENGAEPRNALKEAVKNGLTPLQMLEQGVRDKKWKSYFRADEGGMDYFDNLRSALLLADSPIALCTPWYDNWTGSTIMPQGNNVTNYHMYSCEGWTVINGATYLIIEAWIGRKLYMSREVCNRAMSSWGAQAWVLATDEIEEKRKKTILQKIIDVCVNAILLLKQAIILQAKETPMEQPVENKPKLYTIAKSFLGKRLTLDKSVPKDIGCAQAMSYILKEVGYKIPKGGISGTYTLYEWLNKNFYKTDKLEPGCILISVTGTGNGKLRGHVGVVLDDGIIASNNSATGLLDTHWKYENWVPYYQQVGKLKTVIFKEKSVV
jgi:hypothetical protein